MIHITFNSERRFYWSKLFLVLVLFPLFHSNLSYSQSKVLSDSKFQKKLMTAKSDTARLNIYSSMVAMCNVEDIEKYALLGLALANKLLLSDSAGAVMESKASILGNLGHYYKSKDNFLKALDCFQDALIAYELLKESKVSTLNILTLKNNIGLIYKEQGDTAEAMKIYKSTLVIAVKENIPEKIAQSYNNMAGVFFEEKNLPQALFYYQKAYLFNKEAGIRSSMAINLSNISRIYILTKDYLTADKYNDEALVIRRELADEVGIAQSLSVKSTICFYMKEYALAKQFGEAAYNIALKQKSLSQVNNASRILKDVYKELALFEKSVEMFNIYLLTLDSLTGNELKKDVMKKQLSFEYKKEKEVANLKISEQELKIKQERIQRLALYGGIVLLILFLGFVFNRFKISQKQNAIIEKQKHLVEEKKKEIMDSITYAKRLQDAILPPHEFVTEYFKDNFILYLPKDIVAGDFYWMEHSEGLSFIAAADSTGHGVPGAMVSVVCSNALNRALKEFKLKTPGEILDKTRELVLETFGKSSADVKDGMDISLLCHDQKNNKVYWSGANNPLWYISNNVFEVIKANKQAIGKTDSPLPFTTHEIKVEAGTTFFLLTDGYADQFGGPKGKKFKYKQLEELLLSNAKEPMEVQKQKLIAEFKSWRGDLEQVDDVCVIGIML